MATTHDNLNDLFEDIATSIRAKTGSSATMTAHQMPAQIDSIVTDPSGSCTATDSDILSGKTAYAGGVLRTGNIASYNKGWKEPLTQLCFTANTAGSTIELKIVGSPSIANTAYSRDGNTWTSFTPSATTGTNTIILTNVGDKVYFRNDIVDCHYFNYLNFIMSGSIAASGNCNSMYSAENYNNLTTLTDDFCFRGLFDGCGSLTSAPQLPATTLSGSCYYEMFKNCTSLTSLPELPATNLSAWCYYGMFAYCTSLTTVPSNLLPITTLSDHCYRNMFQYCSSLTTPPILPATALAEWCYRNMFGGCTSLQVNDSPVLGVAEQAWRIPATGIFVNTFEQGDMFSGCAGTRSSNNMPGA